MGKKQRKEKENSTKYGEFVSSFFGWIAPERQKERSRELQEMTKKEDKQRND
ncbi:MAG: hypothetical protein IJH34_02420 [Romboutsia sp.]|nr:hypothetical protein [Romboutsia sp.]